jgi:Type I restriction modification DNA specificity domain.
MNKEIVSFSDVIQFSTGINLSRIEGKKISEESIYSIEDFENDLKGSNQSIDGIENKTNQGKGVIVKPGDCIISMIKSKAGIVSGSSNGKYLSLNFVKCEIDEQLLYSWYFCYLFNEASSIKQQIYKNQQGTVKSVTRLNISTIGDIQFKLVDMEQQKRIGDMYRTVLNQEYLMKHEADLLKRFTLGMMQMIDKN